MNKVKPHFSSRLSEGARGSLVTRCLCIALLASMVAVTACTRKTETPTPDASSAAAAFAPSVMNAEINLVGGGTTRLADYKGKVLLINLWATWCGPCRAETPELVEIYNEFKDRNVEFIALTNEDQTDPKILKAVTDFVQENKMTYKVGFGEDALSYSLARGKQSIPQTLIIAPDGRLLAHIVGYSRSQMNKVRETLQKATSES